MVASALIWTADLSTALKSSHSLAQPSVTARPNEPANAECDVFRRHDTAFCVPLKGCVSTGGRHQGRRSPEELFSSTVWSLARSEPLQVHTSSSRSSPKADACLWVLLPMASSVPDVHTSGQMDVPSGVGVWQTLVWQTLQNSVSRH